MKNKRGFTLVELLAVMVLISALAIITIPNIINYINKDKNQISDATKEIIASAAKLYLQNNASECAVSEGSNCYIQLKKLVDAGYLESPLVDLVSNRNIDLENNYVVVSYVYDADLGTVAYRYDVSNNTETILANGYSIVEGTSITLNNKDIVDYKIYGKSQQQQYTGKNLFDLDAVKARTNIVDADNNIVIPNGAWTYHTGLKLSDIAPKVVAGETYVINLNSTNSGEAGKAIYFSSGTRWNSNNPLQITEAMLNATIYLYPVYGESGNTIISNMQIEKGSQATSYEPYVGGVPSPSTSYPQEIQSVGDLVTDSTDVNYGKYKIPIKVSGKNLLSKEESKLQGIRNESVGTYWATEAFDNDWVINNLKPNTTYTMSFDIECTDVPEYDSQYSPHLGFFAFTSDQSRNISLKDAKYITKGEKVHMIKTFTTPSDINDSSVGWNILAYSNLYKKNGKNVGSSVIFSNIQLEEGSTATTYEPYYSSTTNIYLDDPLRCIGNTCDYIDFQSKKITRNIGEYVVTGSENWIKFDSSHNTYHVSNIIPAKFENGSSVLCNYYVGKTSGSGTTYGSGNCWIQSISTYPRLYIANDNYTNVNDFKSYLSSLSSNPLKVDYILNHPMEESISLPNINTGNGNMIVSVGTTTQPSKVELLVRNK